MCEGVRTRGLGGQVLLKFQSQHEQSQWKHSTDIQPHQKHKPPKETHKEAQRVALHTAIEAEENVCG